MRIEGNSLGAINPKVFNIVTVKAVNKQYPKVIRKKVCKPNVLFEGADSDFSKMVIPWSLGALSPPESTVLQSPRKEQLYGALVGDLMSSLCPLLIWNWIGFNRFHNIYLLHASYTKTEDLLNL